MALRRAASVMVAALLPLLTQAQGVRRDVAVLFNGVAVTLDPPPLEREGLVFVPLRPVFERLGALVVSDAGLIRATADGHTIVLRLGDESASIDGEEHRLESAPITVHGRVLIPLRFVSVALGASADFDADSRTVRIVQVPSTPTPLPPTPAPIALQPIRVEPANGATVARKRPEVSGTFPEAVDPNSITLTLDGRDVTSAAYVSDRSFLYDSATDLAPGAHRVAVSGKTPDREPFSERWSFTSRTAAKDNYINGLEPPSGTFVSDAFSVSAFTLPHAHVHIVATTSPTLATFSEAVDASSFADASADKRGYFTVRLRMAGPKSGLVDVRISSEARDGYVAVRTLRLRQ